MSIRRTVKLLLDKAAARKVERDLKAQSRRIKSEQKRTWKEIGRFVAAAFGIRALARFTSEMFKLGSSAEETGSKFRTVFGTETAAELDIFIKKFGALAGLTKTEGREMLAIAGTIGQGVGLAGPAVAAFAGEIVELAADLQSFHDVPIAETFAAIRSGVTGEAEQLKKFGIILRAVDVDLLALAQSGKTVAKELTETERVTARLQLITEKAGVAVGDLARTQDSTANTARRLSTVWRQLKENLATSVLPVFSLIINGWADIADGAQGTVDVIGKVGRGLTNFVANIQLMAVGLNIFLRSIPAHITNMAAASLEILIAVFVRPAETLINDVRLLFGKEAIQLGTRISATAERLRVQAAIDIAAWKALLEQEVAAIERAAAVVDEAFVEQGGAGAAAKAAAKAEADAKAEAAKEAKEAEAAAEEQANTINKLRIARFQERQKLLEDEAKETLAAVQARAARVADAMTSSFEGFFAASATGFSEAGGVWGAAAEAARGAGASIVEGLTAGRAEEQMAQGVAALASGIWPPNPAAFVAAGKHFAAAALFRAIPGAVKSGGPGGGGGGFGGAGTLPRGALGSSLPGVVAPVGPEIHIYIDPLSPADPDFQRVALGAIQNAQERFGENVSVNIHPRTGRG